MTDQQCMACYDCSRKRDEQVEKLSERVSGLAVGLAFVGLLVLLVAIKSGVLSDIAEVAGG